MKIGQMMTKTTMTTRVTADLDGAKRPGSNPARSAYLLLGAPSNGAFKSGQIFMTHHIWCKDEHERR
jgi:hypothetical protein